MQEQLLSNLQESLSAGNLQVDPLVAHEILEAEHDVYHGDQDNCGDRRESHNARKFHAFGNKPLIKSHPVQNLDHTAVDEKRHHVGSGNKPSSDQEACEADHHQSRKPAEFFFGKLFDLFVHEIWIRHFGNMAPRVA
jgi:hypothetical protein